MTITLVGLSDAKGDAEKISEAIKSHIDPIPDFKLSFERCEDKEFVVLDVLPGNQTPYYYIGDGQMQAFMRVGNESTGEACFLHRMPHENASRTPGSLFEHGTHIPCPRRPSPVSNATQPPPATIAVTHSASTAKPRHSIWNVGACAIPLSLGIRSRSGRQKRIGR